MSYNYYTEAPKTGLSSVKTPRSVGINVLVCLCIIFDSQHRIWVRLPLDAKRASMFTAIVNADRQVVSEVRWTQYVWWDFIVCGEGLCSPSAF